MKISDILREYLEQDIHTKLNTNSTLLNKLYLKFDSLIEAKGYEYAVQITNAMMPSDLSKDWYVITVAKNDTKIQKALAIYADMRNKLSRKICSGL